MMNLRLATRDSIERAIAEFEEATRHDPEYAMAWAALGGAYCAQGLVPEHPGPRAQGHGDGAARARDRSGSLGRAQPGSGSALLSLGRVDEAIASIQEAIRLDPGNGQAHQALARALLGRQGGLRRRRSRCSSARSCSIRRRATRTCSSGCCCRGRGATPRPSASCAARSICRTSSSPATPACRWSAPTRGSATSTTCRAATTTRSASTSAAWRSCRPATTRSRSAA